MRDWARELVAIPEPEYPRFEAGLSVLGALGPDEATALLAQRLEVVERELTAQRASLQHLGQQVSRLFLVEAEYDLAMREAEASWIAALLAELRSGSFPDVEQWRAYSARQPERAGADETPATSEGQEVMEPADVETLTSTLPTTGSDRQGSVTALECDGIRIQRQQDPTVSGSDGTGIRRHWDIPATGFTNGTRRQRDPTCNEIRRHWDTPATGFTNGTRRQRDPTTTRSNGNEIQRQRDPTATRSNGNEIQRQRDPTAMNDPGGVLAHRRRGTRPRTETA